MSKAQIEKSKALDRRTVKRKPDSHQPSMAEKEQEMDMPEASEETVRSTFLAKEDKHETG